MSLQTLSSGFETSENGKVFRFTAMGAWTLHDVARLDEALGRVRLPRPSSGYTAVLDLGAVERLDTAGAWLLHRTAKAWEAAACLQNSMG